MVNNSSQYSGCHGGNYYYGNWGGVDSCNGSPNYTVKLCWGSGYSSCRTDATYDNWDGARYGWDFGADSDFDATVEPIFDNGKNTPDGTVFDHWESYAVDDYGGRQSGQAGTTIPASIHIYDPYHNGVWFFYKYPIPTPLPNTTPTPPPAPAALPCGSPASGATSVNSSSVVFNLGSDAAAYYYYFRLDNLTTGQYDLVITNALTSAFYGPVTLNSATNYQYRVAGKNSSGVLGPWTTCPFSTQPTLGTQGRVPNTRDNAVAGNGISGLRALDDPNVSANIGSNYANSLIITQNIIGGNSSNTKLVGAAFTSKGSPPVNSTLYEMTRSAYSNNGFVLIYAAQAASTVYKTQNWWDDMQNFTPYHYYLYFNGNKWIDLGTAPTDPHKICDGGNNCEAWIDSSSINPLQLSAFDIRLYKNLGSRTWGTYGYLRDSSDTQTSTAY